MYAEVSITNRSDQPLTVDRAVLVVTYQRQGFPVSLIVRSRSDESSRQPDIGIPRHFDGREARTGWLTFLIAASELAGAVVGTYRIEITTSAGHSTDVDLGIMRESEVAESPVAADS